MNHLLDLVVAKWVHWISAATWQLALLVAIVAVLAWLAKRASPRFRYALWLLVLIKVFLPPSLTIDWGIGHWGVKPLWNSLEPTTKSFFKPQSFTIKASSESAGIANEISHDASLDAGEAIHWKPATVLFAIWCIGCGIFLFTALWHYRRITQATKEADAIEEGPLRISIEKIALRLRLRKIPQLYVSDEGPSPFLFGVLRPCIVLPRAMTDTLSRVEMDDVLFHELSHWKRRDTWVGWVQVLGQSLFWFHPFVWWANASLRHERECVCDEAVLRNTESDPGNYGETLLKVLSTSRGRSLAHGSLVGVFEPGGNIQTRLEEIMNFDRSKDEFGLLSRGAVVALALLLLPMAIPAISANTKEDTGTAKQSAAEPRRLPWVEKTNPPVGATDVDPDLSAITITFDRDMVGGMSWTGGKDSFLPPSPDEATAYWKDRRTCVLPVDLSAGEYYRVGINSTSFRNFKSQQGESAPCSVIYFVTTGANQTIKSRMRVPKIVKLYPENNSKNVSHDTNRLAVTFDTPMGKGMSWTGGGENFPELIAGSGARWTNGGKTCVLSVKLRPSWHYILGINSPHHINFQSKWGVPADPVEYRFTTSAE